MIKDLPRIYIYIHNIYIYTYIICIYIYVDGHVLYRSMQFIVVFIVVDGLLSDV